MLRFGLFRRFSSQLVNNNYQIKQNNNSSIPITFDKEQIIKACKIRPELSSYSEHLWYQSYETFSNYGFTTNAYLEIVYKYPEIIPRHPKIIIQSLELWRSCQFGEKSLLQLIQNHPNFLDIGRNNKNNDDSKKLLKKVTFIRSYVTSIKNVWKLLMNSPNLINDTDEIIEEKFNYLINVMRCDIPEICKSEVFSKSLDEIKCRHIFLERLGLFKPKSLKSESKDLTNNPKLYRIIDTSDRNFSTKLCKVTLDEYEAFKELFKRELLLDNDNGDDDDESENEL